MSFAVTKKYRSTILFLLLTFIFMQKVFGNQLNQAHTLFYQGNAHYSEEKFDKAVADYEGTLTLGLESGQLYYNLGNAYFKQGLLGKAILNYLRAQRFIPRDADLQTNLDYAQSLIKGGQVVAQRKLFVQIFFKLASFFSLNELTLLSSILYFALMIIVILIITVKKLKKIFVYLVWPVLIFLIIFGSLCCVKFYQTVIQSQAVVIVRTCDCKFEPFADATTYFTLSEGESIFLLGVQEEWVKIRRADGRGGWIKQQDIEQL